MDARSIILRTYNATADSKQLAEFDIGFEASEIYEVTTVVNGFRLELAPRQITKRYEVDPRELIDLPYVLVAVRKSKDCGLMALAAVDYSEWNRRLVVKHFYVGRQYRTAGLGTAMMSALEEYALRIGARAVWLETQNTNTGAIAFYRALGFELCGLDTDLYDSSESDFKEIALYMTKSVGNSNSSNASGLSKE